ncbi:hypothetical protein LOTGIDRAFT_167327 [Lottia gigantea]|uniref:Uncharacterized protein n=1 Tax=Lottia gigantea TaxID=225164 RepID=V3ZUN0_LOTGI|nr:hypothetical protein LOTGIDRAFT_167327 [Lottia gigantea]ESO86285.1 hypothetical protein LOTGIDRAFT_167327 [Lottia gigantea]
MQNNSSSQYATTRSSNTSQQAVTHSNVQIRTESNSGGVPPVYRISDPIYASIPEEHRRKKAGGGGGHIVSPTGTLQHSHHGGGGQQQYQTTSSTVQQQQFHQNFSNHDGLSVDTNHIGTLPRGPSSAGSPPSPSSGLNTLRHQLTTSHSMTGGALSPGPHSMTGQSSPSVYFGLSRRGSLSSLAGYTSNNK